MFERKNKLKEKKEARLHKNNVINNKDNILSEEIQYIDNKIIENKLMFLEFNDINNIKILIVSSDLPYIGGAGTNSYNIIKSLRKINRYKIYGLFITNIEGDEDPEKLNFIYKVKIDDNIDFNLKNIKNTLGKIDIIIIKNYKSFVFIDKIFLNTKKIFIISGLRHFTHEIESKSLNSEELIKIYKGIDKNIDYDFDNTYEFVLKNDLYLENYVFNKSCKLISNSEITKNILKKNLNIDSTFINTTFINFNLSRDIISFNDRKYDLIFICYDLSRKLKNYDLVYKILNTNKLDNINIIIIVKTQNIIKILKPNIKYLDYVDNKILLEYIKNTKTILIPSMFDSNPNTLKEALSFKCNIITSKNVGNYDILNKNLIINDFYSINEWIDKIILSIEKEYIIDYNIIYYKINNKIILSEIIKEIESLFFDKTLIFFYNISHYCDNFYKNYLMDKNYLIDKNLNISNKIYKCSVHNYSYDYTCYSCKYILLLESNDLNFINLENNFKKINYDNSLSLPNSIYYDICINYVSCSNNYNKFIYISYDNSILENNSIFNYLKVNNIDIYILVLRNSTDILRFRYSKLTFLRGFYNFAHIIFKNKKLFYAGQCLEYSITNNFIGFPKYDYILYHNYKDKKFYEKFYFQQINLINFNKFYNNNNIIINENRYYDILYIADGTSVVKNIILFTKFLDYVIDKKENIKILIVSDNKIFKNYDNYENIKIIKSSGSNNLLNNLSEIYNNSRINIVLSIYDYNPRVITESSSYGCYNVMFKDIYSGFEIIEKNNVLGYLIDLNRYKIYNYNKKEFSYIYYEKFIKIWIKIINLTKEKFNHKNISEIFNTNNKMSGVINNMLNQITL